jgi:hypothetical protein
MAPTSYEITRAELDEIIFPRDILKGAFAKQLTLADRAARFANLARELFDRDGYHISLILYLDASGEVTRHAEVRFDDRGDKYHFWHSIAREAEADPTFCGLIFISEFWNRKVENYPQRSLSEAPIVGEGLKVIPADQAGTVILHSLEVADGPDGKRIQRPGDINVDGKENVLAPVLNVWKARQERD